MFKIEWLKRLVKMRIVQNFEKELLIEKYIKMFKY